MKTTAYPVTLDTSGSIPRRLENPCEYFVVRALTGTVNFRTWRGGEYCPLALGDYFRTVPGEVFSELTFKGGGSITLIAGYGEFQSFAVAGAGGSTTMQIYTGAFADPNGNINPTDTAKPALYYDDPLTTTWAWSVIAQNWTQLI